MKWFSNKTFFYFPSFSFAMIGFYVVTSLLIILSNVSSLTSLTKAKHVMFFLRLVFSVLYERSRSPLFCFFVLPDNHML